MHACHCVNSRFSIEIVHGIVQTSGSQPRVNLPSWGHLAMSGGIFGSHIWVREGYCLLASSD